MKNMLLACLAAAMLGGVHAADDAALAQRLDGGVTNATAPAPSRNGEKKADKKPAKPKPSKKSRKSAAKSGATLPAGT